MLVFIILIKLHFTCLILGNNKVNAIPKYANEISKNNFVKLSPKVTNAQCVLEADHRYIHIDIYIYITALHDAVQA